MEYKNIGIYALCRIPTIGEVEHFRREAQFKGTRNVSWDKKNFTVYMDEARVGEHCDRPKLDQLIADAETGTVDHIIIADVLDLWHSPQKIYEAMKKLSQLETPVAMHSCPTSQYWTLRNPVPFDDWEGSLILNSLHARRLVDDLQFVYDNYDNLDERVRNGIISRCIDPEMIEEYLLFYYLEPRDMEVSDFAKLIGVETDDIEILKECWLPNAKPSDVMIRVLGKELLAFFLA